MKRYTFLLLAFFLSYTIHAEGIGLSTSMMNVNVAPSGLPHDEEHHFRKKSSIKRVIASKNNLKVAKHMKARFMIVEKQAQ